MIEAGLGSGSPRPPTRPARPWRHGLWSRSVCCRLAQFLKRRTHSPDWMAPTDSVRAGSAPNLHRRGRHFAHHAVSAAGAGADITRKRPASLPQAALRRKAPHENKSDVKRRTDKYIIEHAMAISCDRNKSSQYKPSNGFRPLAPCQWQPAANKIIYLIWLGRSLSPGLIDVAGQAADRETGRRAVIMRPAPSPPPGKA
ncbi:hypothetical protein C7450_105149 [Chelatococcus asaccharovorans]|uniref:Uncharacterized protein n=1 Tax=Chelatococcus asaccharovorans TaxID=28210 RepID=A0A2V3U6G7_9HYPH|nr:hypothetical protein C7450_105149 [Chelatococcus asaccharovorans]